MLSHETCCREVLHKAADVARGSFNENEQGILDRIFSSVLNRITREDGVLMMSLKKDRQTDHLS